MNPIVFSLGGSAIVPDHIDVEYIRKFRDFALELSADCQKIGIVVGGGRTARVYQEAARSIEGPEDTDLDLIGIRATLLNAELVRSTFGDNAYKEVIVDPTKDVKIGSRILVASGWKPGFSTDYVSVKLAELINAKRLINLTNVDYVYEENPKDNPDAEPITEMTWAHYMATFGAAWKPGMHSPFDPVAAEHANKIDIEVAVINGNDIENIKNFTYGKPFRGTLIKKG